MKTHNFHATRAVDVFRGRTGLGPTAGVGSILGIPITGTPADGQVLEYDAATNTWVLVDIGAIGSTTYLTKYGGEGHDKVTNLAATGAVTIDCSLANIFDLTLTGSITITITNPPAPTLGGIITIILRQGGSGSYTVTWPPSVYWQAADGTNAGSAPTLHTVVGAQDDISLATLDGGTTWGGQLGGSATGGTVTSVALTVPAEFSVAGSPVTSSGTLAITKANESANTVWAGPTSGSAAAPTFRALTAADIPAGVTAAVPFTVIGQETRTSDGSTTTYLLDNDYDDNSVQAFNLTSGKALVVTENGTNSVTIGAAGTAGDSLAFAYAALAA